MVTFNGSFQVLSVSPQFGAVIDYEFKNFSYENLANHDYIIAQWSNPLATFNFSFAFFDQDIFDELKTFFDSVNGGVDTFLFEDPLNYQVSQIDYDTNLGIIEQGIIYLDNGVWQLGKKITLTESEGALRTFSIVIPITNPKSGSIQVYDSGLNPIPSSINLDTGEIITGGGVGHRWTGQYYTPVRFLNETIPFSILTYDPINNQQFYSIPDLRLREVRRETRRVSPTLDSKLDHLYPIPIEMETVINSIAKNDLFESESGYTSNTFLAASLFEISIPDQLVSANYAIFLSGFWRLTLGGWASFIFRDAEAGINNYFRFKEKISFKTVTRESDNPEHQSFYLNNINLKQDFNKAKNTYCHKLLIERTDGVIVAMTNHDVDIDFNSQVYSSNIGFASDSPSRASELNTDQQKVQSVFSLQVSEADLIAGKYDNAVVTQTLHDWLNNTEISTTFRGTIGGHSIGYLPSGGKQYELEFLSSAEQLDIDITLVTTSDCRHKFLSQGYGKCNRPIDSNVRVTDTIGVVTDGKTITLTGTNYTDFQYGTCKFTSGNLNGYSGFISSSGSNFITLLNSTPVVPEIGDTCEISKGCSKQLEACENYNNVENFGGFPELPGIDTTIATPE